MWLGIIRRWRPVLAWWVLVCLAAVLAAACGGGKDGTGPSVNGGGRYAGDYRLAGANDEAVPTVVTSDACAPARIVNGGLTVNRNGQWEMQFNWEDNTGAPIFLGDRGHWEEEIDGWVRFSSEQWGDSFEGELDEELMWIDYDFCSNDPPGDLELAFSR
jgi:hypothetical protein